MIKVALEDALMKLKDHFHGEKHSQQGCFSNCTQTTDDIQKAYSKITLSLLHVTVQDHDNTAFHCGTTACLQAHNHIDSAQRLQHGLPR